MGLGTIAPFVTTSRATTLAVVFLLVSLATPSLSTVAQVFPGAGESGASAEERPDASPIADPKENPVDEAAGHLRSEEVCLRVAELRGEFELLRFHMGRPRDDRPVIEVRGASARETYYQAIVLLENTERLAFEFLREREDVPADSDRPVTLDDVSSLLERTLGRVERIKNHLHVSGAGRTEPSASCSDPNDVLREIVLANRQLNLLLERPVAPEDVYRQVSLAIAYLSRILEQFPEPTRIPPEPAIVPGRVPADVCRRLLRCFDRLHATLEGSGLTMLEFEVTDGDLDRVVPSDVLHLSSMLVAELAMIQRALPGTRAPRRVFAVGRKFPSHVDQRVAVLEAMLEEFEIRVARHPGWLTGEFEE